MLAFGIEITTDLLADGAVTTPKLADGAVDNTKLADMAQGLLKGRAAGGGTGDPQDLTATQVKAILDLQASEVDFSNVASGLTATTVQDAIDELDSLVDALGNGMVFKGTFDAGGGAGPVNFPGGGTAQAGWFYPVINAAAGGTTLGSSNPIVVHTGDKLVAAVDNASATDGANWDLIDGSDAVTSVAGKVGTVVLEVPDITGIATDRLLGRDTAGTGVAEEIAVGGGLEFGGAANIQRSALTGDVTASAGSNATTIANDAVSNAKLRNSGALSVIGRSANSGGDPADISAVAASGAVLRESGSVLGFGTIATAGIADDAITNAKLANMATQTIKGRTTAGTGDPEDLTAAQVVAILGLGEAMEFRGDFNAGGTAGPVNFPGSGAEEAGGTYFVTNAHANGTTLGTSNALVVFNGDQLVARQDSASATNGAHWAVFSGSKAATITAGTLLEVLNGSASITKAGIPSLNYTNTTASDADGDVLSGGGRASANAFFGVNVGAGAAPFNVATSHTTGAVYAGHDSNTGIGHGANATNWASRLTFAVNPGQGHPDFATAIAAQIPVPALVIFSDGDVAIDPAGRFDGVGATQPMPKGGDLIMKEGFRVGPDGGGQFAPADRVQFKEFNLRINASQTDLAAIYGAISTAAGDMLVAFDGWVVGIAAYAIDSLPASATVDLDLWVNGANEGATLTLQLNNGTQTARNILTPANYFALSSLDKVGVRGTSNGSVSASTDIQIELIVIQRMTVGSVDP